MRNYGCLELVLPSGYRFSGNFQKFPKLPKVKLIYVFSVFQKIEMFLANVCFHKIL